MAYVRADVTDPVQVREAVAAVEASLGPVTAILHSAGVNVPVPVTVLGGDEVMATLGPKVTGLRNLVAAVDPRRLRLLVAFGSLIARTGLRGEAHYGLANEWLALDVDRIRKDRPHCRCLILEWLVWSGAGMAERLGVVETLRREEGIQAIPPAQAVSALTGVLWQPEVDGAVVLTGRFGKAAESSLDRVELPLWRFLEQARVHYPGIEFVVDTSLAPETDLYLADHHVDGNDVMPAALLLEAMAQAATALTGSRARPSFHDIEFSTPVVVGDSSQVLRVAALAEGGSVKVACRASGSRFLTDHVRAVCRVGSSAGRAPADPIDLPLHGAIPTVDVDRDLYGSLLFQAGRFRRVCRYRHLKARDAWSRSTSGRTTGSARSFPPICCSGTPGSTTPPSTACRHAYRTPRCCPWASMRSRC